MTLEDQIAVNKYGQGLVAIEQLTEKFRLLDWAQKKTYMNDMLYLIMQSQPKEDDIEPVIEESGLKHTFTPCVLLRKGVANHHLLKIIELPEIESDKVIVLMLHLFRVAYKRRFDLEKTNPDKWWYWDLKVKSEE